MRLFVLWSACSPARLGCRAQAWAGRPAQAIVQLGVDELLLLHPEARELGDDVAVLIEVAGAGGALVVDRFSVGDELRRLGEAVLARIDGNAAGIVDLPQGVPHAGAGQRSFGRRAVAQRDQRGQHDGRGRVVGRRVAEGGPSKLNLRSESEDNSMIRASSDVGVILDHRLQKKHWSRVKQNVELEAVLCPPRKHSGRGEL